MYTLMVKLLPLSSGILRGRLRALLQVANFRSGLTPFAFAFVASVNAFEGISGSESLFEQWDLPQLWARPK